MDLLERYLSALRPLLPRKAGGDIVREIADEIQSQMEDEADILGRPLTEDEQAAIIRKQGHPIVVAARYGQARYLIGPELFPFYWRTLKVSIVVALAIWSVVIAMSLTAEAEPGKAWMPQLMRIPGELMTVFGVVTGLFAAAQFSRPFVRSKLEPRWDPRSLPVGGQDTAKRTQSVVEAFFGIVGLLWWQLVPSLPFLALGPAASFLKLGTAWDLLHWPVLILIAANTLKSAIQAIRPERTVTFARFVLLLDAAELVVLLVAVRANEWIAVQPELAGTEHFAATADVLSRIVGVGCFVALIIRAVQFAFKCIRHWRQSESNSGVAAVSVL